MYKAKFKGVCVKFQNGDIANTQVRFEKWLTLKDSDIIIVYLTDKDNKQRILKVQKKFVKLT